MVVAIPKAGGACKLKCTEYPSARLLSNTASLECALSYGFEGYLTPDWMQNKETKTYSDVHINVECADETIADKTFVFWSFCGPATG